jgi:ATP phosphoribosyltransferase regulatory subunit
MIVTRFKKQLPQGVEDLLPQECYLKRKLESKIRDVFANAGYDEVSTPSYEYYDAFATGAGSYLQEKMIKFFDLQGSILTLRPDLTIPIARMATSKLMNQTDNQRLFYLENSFRIEKPAVGRSSEFSQAGIELIGENGVGSDAEVISIAISCMLACGLDDFKIDIGQVSFFKALIKDDDFDADAIDNIRHLIDAKNEFELNKLLVSLGASETLKKKLTQLMTLFGGQEVFDKARKLSDDVDCIAAIENLEKVYDLLCAFGYSQYICIDFGMLHDISYYTGTIFRGITDKIGFPIITGGRYDNLLDDFGKDLPATGFALWLKRLMIVLERSDKLSGFYTTDYVVSCDDAVSEKAYAFVSKLRKAKKRVLFCAGLSKEKLLTLKDEKNANQAIYFDIDGEGKKL